MAERLLTFVHLSDTHLHVDPNHSVAFTNFSSREPVQKLIAAVNALPMDIDFVMHTGDVVDYPETPDHYALARDILSQLRFPVYYIPGNHDRVLEFQRDFIGTPQSHIQPHYDYEFECNGVQIVMLDSHAPDSEDTAAGHLAETQLARLDGICSTNDTRPLVIGLHHHAIPLEAPWLDTMVLMNGLDLHRVLLKAKERLRGVFYGHIHETVVTMRDGISYFSVQSGWFQGRTWYAVPEPVDDIMNAPGFNLVTLTTSDTFVRFVRVPL